MKIVVCAYGNRVKLGVVKNFVVVVNRRTASVFFYSFIRAVMQYIAEILDFGVVRCHVCGNVRRICDISASDNCNCDFILSFCSSLNSAILITTKLL